MDTFTYLSDACLEAQKATDVDDIWLELRRRVPQMLEKPPCAASRQALARLVGILGARSAQSAHQSELCTVFMQYLETHKKAWSHRVFAVWGLKALCDIQNDNVRGLRSNVFTVLLDCTKTGSATNYKLALLEALRSAQSPQSDASSSKVAWKYARSHVFDTSLAVSRASLSLMAAICRPQFVATQAKFDKVAALCVKAWKEGKDAAHLLLRAVQCAQDSKVTTIKAQMALKCQEYASVSPKVAKGYVAFLAECMRLDPHDVTHYVSLIPQIFQSPKMRAQDTLDRAYGHAVYLLVDVVAGALVEEKQKFGLVQSVVTKLATTDKHHQVLAACYVMVLERLLDLVVVSPAFADILYQTEIALFELSTQNDLTFKTVRLIVKTLEKAPQYYTQIGRFALDAAEFGDKHAYLLGAVLVSSGPHMTELKPQIVERGMDLVKQKGQKFSLESHKQGWILLQAFCCTPPKALRLFIPSYLSLFSHMLAAAPEPSAPSAAAPEAAAAATSNSLRYRLEIWKPVLDCMVAFARTTLVTPDISRKLGALVQTAWNALETVKWEDALEGQEQHIRKRLLKCFYYIDFHGDGSFYPATLMIQSLAAVAGGAQGQGQSEGESAPSASSYTLDPVSVLYGKPACSNELVEFAQRTILKLFPQQLDRVKESLLDSLRSSIEAQAAKAGKATSLTSLCWLFSEICACELGDPRLLRTVDGLVKTCLRQSLPYSDVAAGNFISQSSDLFKFLLEQIIATTEPTTRASHVLALTAAIQHGGLSSYHLRETLEVLVKLSKDPHPTVHMAAIDCVCTAASRSGLLGEKEATKLLEHLTSLMLDDNFCSASSIVEYSNLECAEENSWFRLSRGLTQLISLFGPSLQDSEPLFKLLYRLVDQLPFKSLTWACYQELFYYAKERINWVGIISEWRRALVAPSAAGDPLAAEAAQGILLFCNRNASRLFDLTGRAFQDELWQAYDEHPSPALGQILEVWAEQTVTLEPHAWIARLQGVISKPKFEQKAVEQDDKKEKEAEEDEGLGPQSEVRADLYNPHTRQLALQILREITLSQLHDKPLVVRQSSLITQNIGEIIKISFNAATCTVLELQVQGLQLLNLLIEHLWDLKDPEFPEVSLLEQYQAQISSALTPAFNSDSSYELASAVIAVCGNFVGSRIIKNEKFNKILKLLTEPLTSESNTIGQLELEPLQAQALRISILRFWAVLETDKSDVVLGHETQLAKLWVDALTLYTKLEFRPDDANGSAFFAESLRAYRTFNEKAALLPVYRASWVDLVSALAVLVEKRGPQVLGNEELLMGIVGLCFAELLKGTSGHLNVLQALRQILQPGVCASLVYHEEIFLEVVEVLDRIVLTGSVPEKTCVIHIARSLAMSQAESDDSVDHLFEIFRTCVFPLKELFPFLIDPNNPINPNAVEQLPLIKLALESLVDMAQVFREVIQNDQLSCLLFVFEQIFGRDDCAEIVPHLFSAFKRLVEVMARRDLQKALCDVLVRTLAAPPTQNSALEAMVLLCSADRTLGAAVGNIREFGARLAAQALEDSEIAVQSTRSIIKSTSGDVQAAFLAGVVPALVAALPTSTALPKNTCNILVDYARHSKDPEAAMAIVVPCLLHVLHSSWDTEERRNMYIRALLLMLVDAHPQQFKQQMVLVTAQDKEAVQELLLEPAEPIPEPVTDVIALTSFS